MSERDSTDRAWKLVRDPYLGPLVKAHGEQVAWDAGFFLDADPTDAPLDDVDWLCTPLPKRRARSDAPKVLLATGGFFPLHAGHLAMMEEARRTAEHAGWEIIGGYLSPGHDDYLRHKCGDAAAPASERLRLVGRAIANSDWLSVDPWEALHRRVAVNYTDVAARLEAYLRAHVHPQLTVVYVCGGDNARFASAFVARGGCIVVGRPGAETESSRWQRTLAGHPRILFAQGGSPLASRDLRAKTAVRPPLPSLLVRCEDARVVRTLGLSERLPAFQEALLNLLRSYARVRVEHARPEPVTGSADPSVISLDPLHPARFNLALSRLFAVGGYQPLGHVARPGHPLLAAQLARIPPGEYRLRDDDAMSGSTLAAVRRALPAHVRITTTELALARDPSEDVLDARDFLLGADEGGLVLAWPDGLEGTSPRLGRAPYLLPYVDPCVRASIPDARGFSSAAWDLNARFFADSGRKVGELPAPARAMFSFAGTGTRLEDLCRWHAERLARLAPLTLAAGRVDNPRLLRPG